MQYMVFGSDGKEYGPVDLEGLREWKSEGRLNAQSTLRDFDSGRIFMAQEISELFSSPNPAYATPYGGAPAPAPVSSSTDEGFGPLIGVVFRSAAAVAVFFLLHGLGVIIGGYALYYAIRCQIEGYRYGWLAILVAILALAIVGTGWMLRLGGAGI